MPNVQMLNEAMALFNQNKPAPVEIGGQIQPVRIGSGEIIPGTRLRLTGDPQKDGFIQAAFQKYATTWRTNYNAIKEQNPMLDDAEIFSRIGRPPQQVNDLKQVLPYIQDLSALPERDKLKMLYNQRLGEMDKEQAMRLTLLDAQQMFAREERGAASIEAEKNRSLTREEGAAGRGVQMAGIEAGKAQAEKQYDLQAAMFDFDKKFREQTRAEDVEYRNVMSAINLSKDSADRAEKSESLRLNLEMNRDTTMDQLDAQIIKLQQDYLPKIRAASPEERAAIRQEYEDAKKMIDEMKARVSERYERRINRVTGVSEPAQAEKTVEHKLPEKRQVLVNDAANRLVETGNFSEGPWNDKAFEIAKDLARQLGKDISKEEYHKALDVYASYFRINRKITETQARNVLLELVGGNTSAKPK